MGAELYFFTIFLMIFFTTIVQASDYYVDFDGGNDTNIGTQASPWRNIPGTRNGGNSGFITNSWAKINAGDTIWIKSGTIHDFNDGGRVLIDSSYYNNGTSASPITIKRNTDWGTGQIVIDGTGITTGRWAGLVDIYRNYIVFDGAIDKGILVQNSAYDGVSVYGTGTNGTTIQNIEVYNSQNANVLADTTNKSTPLYIGGITIKNVVAHKTNVNDDWASNIYLSFADSALVDHVTAYDSSAGGDGIHLSSSRNSWVINSTVYNNGEQGIDLSRDGDYKNRDDGYNVTIRDCVGYNNYKMNFDHNSGYHDVYYIRNVGWATTISEVSDGNLHVYEGTAGKNVWINNTSLKGRDWGYGLQWSGNPYSIPAGTYNQIYINNISHLDSGYSLYVDSNSGGTSFNPILFNNNFNSGSGSTVARIKGTNYTRDNINLGTGGWPGTNDKAVDPLFVSVGSTWATSDLRLQSASPCAGSGVFPFTTSNSGSGSTIVLSKITSDLDARRVFRPGDVIQIEDSGQYNVQSVDSSNQITLNSQTSWGNGKGVWFPWSGAKPDMGAL